VVNAITCCTRGQQITAEMFGHDVLWQPYVDPGLILARALRRSLAGRSRPAAIFLQNHGLIVGGETAVEIAATTDRIVSTVRQRLPAPPSVSDTDRPTLDRLADIAREAGLAVEVDDSPAVRWLASTPVGRKAATGGPLTPDQIVYCRSAPMVIEPRMANRASWDTAWSAYREQYGFNPWVVLVPGAGALAVRVSGKLAEVTRDVYADAAAVYRDAAMLGSVHHLGPRDRKFIEEWEVEAHRRAVMSTDEGDSPSSVSILFICG
jgi:rhamnose utilization protein RhaD (predicted bifunctional aldolase and dehydrogenase)